MTIKDFLHFSYNDFFCYFIYFDNTIYTFGTLRDLALSDFYYKEFKFFKFSYHKDNFYRINFYF